VGISRFESEACVDVGYGVWPVSGTAANLSTTQVGGCRLRGQRDCAVRLVFGPRVAQTAAEHALKAMG
jgi:hypothetical protein